MQYGLIDELRGFMALSSIPIALVAVVAIGLLTIWFVTAALKASWKKWVAGLIVSLILVSILTWDVIVGRFNFNRLCATESRIRVYIRVKLDPEFGDTQFSDNALAYEQMPIAKRYPYTSEASEDISGPAIIKFSRKYIRDGQTGEVLGTITHYFYGGGWFENAISNHPDGGICGDEKGSFSVLLKQIFEMPQ